VTSQAATTNADRVYRAIRLDILNGRLAPGSRMRVEQLRERYQVSSGVVREALPRLAGEGLAVLAPQQGYSVISVSEEDLRHLTQARIAIETQVFRQSIEAGDLEWEARVVSAHHTLSRISMVTDSGDLSEDWAPTHAAFHGALLMGCPNAWLRGMAASMRELAEVYRSWSWKPGEARDRAIAAEHEELRDLALARDADGGCAALATHIRLTTEILLEARYNAVGGHPT
jgi:DNA-binding GntR family transcriptional regulator